MPVISNTIDVMYKAQDHASRVVGNINTSLASQLAVFGQLGLKIPIVGRNLSTMMVTATMATERYVRELIELKKHTNLNMKELITYQHAIEQSGVGYDTLVRLTDKLSDARRKQWKVENQLYTATLMRYNILDKEKGIMTDTNEVIKRAADEMMKYKEGVDRLRFAQEVFGDESLVPFFEKQAEATKLAADRYSDYVALTELAAKQIKENQSAVSELTGVFKEFGVNVATAVLPVLLAVIKFTTAWMDVMLFLLKPILAVVRHLGYFITVMKDMIGVLGIAGKLIIWVAVFVLGFYIRNLLLTQILVVGNMVATNNWIVSLRGLGGVIKWVGKFIVDFMLFPLQSTLIWIKSLIGGVKDWIGNLKNLTVATYAYAKANAVAAIEVLLLVGMFLAVYELANKLLWLFHELEYFIASVFGDESSSKMKRFRQEIDLIQKDIDAWSLEGMWDRITRGMSGVTEEAGKTKKEMNETFDISRDMYDSLGDTLERVVNLPADMMPSLMQRMKANQENFKAIDRASRAYRGAYNQTMANMPAPSLDRAQSVKVELKQKVEFGDFAEPIMKTLEGLGLR